MWGSDMPDVVLDMSSFRAGKLGGISAELKFLFKGLLEATDYILNPSFAEKSAGDLSAFPVM